MNNGEGFAFFCWHRHQYPYMSGINFCRSSGDPRSLCRKAWAYKWSLS